MDDKALRQHLVKYRATRDPASMAALFEITAPQLWQLAMHLSRDPADADDLLQSTFLAVIESVERYDEGQPAMGWMMGILTNQARSQRRRSARRPDPDRLLETLPGSPVEKAQTEEERTLVSDAIASLPQLYRQVLELVVDKGIGPAEIAARLSRTPATVRVQLHRATALLRRGLPAGMALPVALISVQSIGLESVRHQIHKAALKNASSMGSGILAAKIAAAVLGLAALSASTWAVIQGGASSSTPMAVPPTISNLLVGPSIADAPRRTPIQETPEVHEPSTSVPSPPTGTDERQGESVAQTRVIPFKASVIPVEPRMIPFEKVIHRGDGISFEAMLGVTPHQPDLVFRKSSSMVEATGSIRLARVSPNPGRKGSQVAALAEMRYLDNAQADDRTLPGHADRPFSKDAHLLSVGSFDPDQLAWQWQMQLADERGRAAVVLVKCPRGYAVMALVATRWNSELREDESILRGFYNPDARDFSGPH